MQFKDLQAWTDQELELKQDDVGQKFLEFFLRWFDIAENLYAQTETVGGDRNDSERTVRRYSCISAVRHALLDAENHFGYASMEWLGQMLLLAQQHWVHGADMDLGLTILERRLLEQMTAVKLVELQTMAEQV
jgi:hypothetical protein